MAASLANYLLFFGPAFVRNRWTAQRDAQRLQRFKAATGESTLHRCTTCGRTEVSHPDLDFRVTASGEEFCAEHLPQR